MTTQDTSSLTRILVTGAGGPAGYTVIERLQETNPSFILHAADASHLASGLYLVPEGRRHVVPMGKDPRFGWDLLELCRHWSIDVVIPTVDAELVPLATMSARFARAGTRLALSPLEGLETCADKARLTRALADVVPTATTTIYSGQELPADMPMPLIAKPRSGSGARGIQKIDAPEDLASVPDDGSFMLMDYLPGAEYSVDVFRSAASGVIAAVPRERMRVDSGVAIAARTVHDEELEHYAGLAVEALGLEGVANVQFRRDAEGTPRLLEINPRFPGTMPLTVGAGVDMPNMAVAEARGESLGAHRRPFRDIALVRRWQDQFIDPKHLAEPESA